MDRGHAQIQNWVETRRHQVQVSYEHATSDKGGTAPIEPSPPAEDSTSVSSEGITADGVTDTISTHSNTPDKLIGADDDWLIPEPSQIARVYRQGRRTWTQLVTSARSFPPNTLPTAAINPTIMLKDVPALPSELPKITFLVGQPVWHVPEAEEDDVGGGGGVDAESFTLDQPYGTHKYIHLSFPTPIKCSMSSNTEGDDSGSDQGVGQDTVAPPGLMLLTLCWSYILSVRLWEIQGKAVTYTRHGLRTEPRVNLRENDQLSNNVKIDLGKPASRQLVAWLCALLAPKPGWAAKPLKGPDYTPWATLCPDDLQFTLYTDEPVEESQHERPPSSAEAAVLLVEFCNLFGLGHRERRRGRPRKNVSELLPVTAAFLAALALPFYRHLELEPQFPRPTFQRKRQASHVNLDLIIGQYVKDLPYYMTLSMEPRSVGSTIWSIFWQPEIECNLVSPWLSSTLSILKPIIDTGDLGLLARMFAIRRPRVALWWLGIFLLGSPTISAFILRYLDIIEERWGYGSMSRPDTTASAWTGSAQSFLDEDTVDIYTNPKDMVPVADLLKHRYNFQLQDPYRLHLAWRPFGSIPKEKIELDLWPWLEKQYTRTYMHWVWWVKKGGVARRDIQRGFRHDTGRFSPDVVDYPEKAYADGDVGSDTEVDADIKLEPSLQSTIRMLGHCMEDMAGDVAPIDVEGAREHPWLVDSRMFE